MSFRNALVIPFIGALADAEAAAAPFKLVFAEWRWVAGDDIFFTEPEYEDSLWEELKAPASVSLPKIGDIFWLRARIEILSGAPERLWLLTGKAGVALEAYVDGGFADSRESLPPRYEFRSTWSDAILLPGTGPGSAVRPALRFSYRGSRPPIPVMSLGDVEGAALDLSPANFRNVRLHGLLAALCAFLGANSLVRFVLRPKDKVELYYAAMLLFIGLNLQGIAYSLLNVSIFVSMAMRQSKLKADHERYANEVETKTAELGASLEALVEAGEICSAMVALAAAGHSISEEAVRKAKYSERVRSSVAAITAEAAGVLRSARLIVAEGFSPGT